MVEWSVITFFVPIDVYKRQVCDRVQLFPGRHRDLSARLFRPELEKEKAAPRLGPAVNGCTRPHSPGLCVSPHRFAAVRPLAMRPRFIYNTF